MFCVLKSESFVEYFEKSEFLFLNPENVFKKFVKHTLLVNHPDIVNELYFE
jgi:hypothetical protein